MPLPELKRQYINAAYAAQKNGILMHAKEMICKTGYHAVLTGRNSTEVDLETLQLYLFDRLNIVAKHPLREDRESKSGRE